VKEQRKIYEETCFSPLCFSLFFRFHALLSTQTKENGIGLETRLTVHIALQTSNDLFQQGLLAYNL